MAIDPSMDAHWNQDAAQPGAPQSDPMETNIISSKDLYTNFVKMVENKQIDFMRKPMAGQVNNTTNFPKHNDSEDV
jgi:hypothetical protein